MYITNNIENSINRMPKGFIFTYKEFIGLVSNKEAVIKALNRMAEKGKIVKPAKGKYYKPENSVFGKLQPSEYELVKDLLKKGTKVTGYLTGYSIYNKLGLTSQVSSVIQIGKNEVRPSFKRGKISISFIKQKNIITKDNIPLLQIVDSIRYIKKIPDTSIEKACERLLFIIKNLSEKDRTTLSRLVKKYPPSTIALLGALLEETGNNQTAQSLLNILNPLTSYKFTGINNILKSAKKWNIK